MLQKERRGLGRLGEIGLVAFAASAITVGGQVLIEDPDPIRQTITCEFQSPQAYLKLPPLQPGQVHCYWFNPLTNKVEVSAVNVDVATLMNAPPTPQDTVSMAESVKQAQSRAREEEIRSRSTTPHE